MSANEEPNEESVREPEEGESRPSTGNVAHAKQPVPLFLRDASDGRKGNAQDEKDSAEE